MEFPIWLLIGLFVSRCLAQGNGLSWEATYEAIAHIAVGYLIAAAYYDKPNRRPIVIGVVAVSVFELIMGVLHMKGLA